MRKFIATHRRREPVVKAVQPNDPEWRLLHQIADRKITPMRQAVWRAVLATQESVALDKLADAIQAGDLAAAEAAIDWSKMGAERQTVEDILRDLVEESGKTAAKLLSRNTRFALQFELLNPRAVEFVRQHTGELITQITEETRQAVRAVVQRAFVEGGHPYQQARQIREIVGLTERQAKAVDNLRQRLLAEGVPESKVAEQAAKYTERLRQDRALMIARNETLTASNAGQHECWLQAADAGLIDPSKFQREWIATPEERTCDLCLEMDGKLAPLDAPFDTPVGPIMHPPLHIQCRCTTGLREAKP